MVGEPEKVISQKLATLEAAETWVLEEPTPKVNIISSKWVFKAKMLAIFGLDVSIKLFLAKCICDFINGWGLLPIFKDRIKPIHRLNVDTEVVNEN